MIQFYGLLL